jgi:cyclic pyranopterin phosphate synthase
MLRDGFGRQITDLRLSVTDRCNFKCVYCKPQLEGRWVQRSELLTFEELERVARILVSLGIDKVRITGGEPLVRHHIEQLIARIAWIPGLRDLCMTTNGYVLAEKIDLLKRAGLRRVTVSLDTLNADKFEAITGKNYFPRVLEGIDAAVTAGFIPVKVNAVIMRDVNDDELIAFARFAREKNVVFRFIEFMPLDADHQWSKNRVVTLDEMVEKISSYKKLVPLPGHSISETARRFQFEDGVGEIGIIAPVSRPFCGHCSRIRMTADGKIRTCLFSILEHDVRSLLRGGASDDDIKGFIEKVVDQKEERHHINDPDFVQPERDMSLIGG